MHQSESIANLAKALSTVQGKLTYAKKDSKNPFLNPTMLTLSLYGMLAVAFWLTMVWRWLNSLGLIAK